MILANSDMREVEKLIRRKWHQMRWRVNNQNSYIKKGIRILFQDYADFRDYALSKDIKDGFHCHRPDRNGHYCRENLDFISPEAHRKITAREKRKLTDNEVRSIREKSLFKMSQRQIAKEFNVSQCTVWKIVNSLAYTDVI